MASDSSQLYPSPGTSGWASWIHYFGSGSKAKAFGDYTTYSQLAQSYVGDPEAFKTVVQGYWDSGAVLVATSGSKVRALHHLSVLEERGRVLGATTLRRYSSFKELAVSSLVRSMSIPRESSSRKSQTGDLVPTFADFVEWSRMEDVPLKEMEVKNGTDPVTLLDDWPCSFWIHPWHLVSYYDKPRRAEEVARVMSGIAFEGEDISDEDMAELNDRLYFQLLFLWAVEKGFVQSPSFFDPEDSDEVELAKETVHNLLLNPNRWKEVSREENDTAGTRYSPDATREHTDDEARSTNDVGEEQQDNRFNQDSANRQVEFANPVIEVADSGEDSGMYDSTSDDPSSDQDRRRARRRRRSNDRKERDRRRSDRRGGRTEGPARSSKRQRKRSERESGAERSRKRNRSKGAESERSRSEEQKTIPAEEVVTALLQGVGALTKLQTQSVERERRKTSVLGRLAPRQEFLFTALAARNWRDRSPRMSNEAELMLEDKDMERNWNIADDLMREWPGVMSKPAFIQFLANGYIGADKPGGLTCFAFSPPRRRSYGKRDRKRNLRHVLKAKKELDEEDLEFYARYDFYIPQSVPEGELQITMCQRFIALMTHTDGIATHGHHHALEILDEHRAKFYACQEEDKMFMAKYVNFVDTVFRNFCQKLARYHQDPDPIRRAKKSLRHKMRDDIDRIMGDLDLDVTPVLPLPDKLLQSYADGPDDPGRNKVRGKDEDGKKKGAPEWWSKNPDPNPNWKLPAGKRVADFFDKNTDLGTTNRALLPKVKHHHPKVLGQRGICMNYQNGSCVPHCGLAHVPPKDMDADLTRSLDEAIKKIYKGASS